MPRRTEPKRVSAASAERTGFDRKLIFVVIWCRIESLLSQIIHHLIEMTFPEVLEPFCLANFYVVYFKAMSCKIAEIASAGTSVEKCLDSVLTLVQKGIEDQEEQKNVISEIYSRCSIIATMLSNAAENHFNGIDAQIQGKYIQEYVNNASSSTDIMYTLGNTLIDKFGDSYGSIAARSWEDGIKLHNKYLNYLNDKDSNKNIMTKYAERIKKYNPSYTFPSFNTSLFYISTSLYFSYYFP